MLDISILFKRYRFLGFEFLTWLWFLTEKTGGSIDLSEQANVLLVPGDKIVMELVDSSKPERVTIFGEDADLEEARISLNKRMLVREMNFRLKINDNEWGFGLNGENLTFSSFKTPKTGKIEKKDDFEGAILEKIFLYEECVNVVDTLFRRFIKQRISDEWTTKQIPSLKKWITSGI